MPTDTRNLPANFATDADFRQWGQGLSAQFAAIGLVKTADTGQIDWSTVLKPSAASQIRGYEIWRFNDVLQATAPVFIKMEFGSSATATWPALSPTIGTGTNGAGTLTGQIGTTRAVGINTSFPAPGLNSYCSGSNNRLSLASALDPSNANGLMLVCIERPKTRLGIDTSDGVMRQNGSAWNGTRFQFLPYLGVIPAEYATGICLDINAGGLSSSGNNVMLSPAITFWGKPIYGSWTVYKNADITALSPISVDYLGASHTYLPLGPGSQIGGSLGSGYVNAILWE